MWVRGLKPQKVEDNIRFDQSHPMWVRGLKLAVVSLPLIRMGRTPCGCVD